MIHRACRNKNPNVIEYLIQNGADVNAKTKDKCTPLYEAAFFNNIEAVKVLIAHKAKIDASRDHCHC